MQQFQCAYYALLVELFIAISPYWFYFFTLKQRLVAFPYKSHTKLIYEHVLQQFLTSMELKMLFVLSFHPFVSLQFYQTWNTEYSKRRLIFVIGKGLSNFQLWNKGSFTDSVFLGWRWFKEISNILFQVLQMNEKYVLDHKMQSTRRHVTTGTLCSDPQLAKPLLFLLNAVC